MSDVLLRQLIILQNLPQYPSKITTRELLNTLTNQGINSTIRTIQRDLEALSAGGIFGISADKHTKPAGWYWLKQARRLQIPYMDTSTAVAFSLIENESATILPAVIRSQLAPFFRQSRELLKTRNDWTRKISRARPKKANTFSIDPESKELIYKALEEQRCISADIGRFLKGVEMYYSHYSPVHPVGLHLEQNEIYLVVHYGDPHRVYLISLYRVKNVVLLDQPADCCRIDCISDDCNERFNELFQSEVILELEFNAKLLKEVVVTPFSDDQQVQEAPRNWYRLLATVNDDRLLRQRLLRFGSNARVISPKSLGSIIQQEARKILENYSTNRLTKTH